MASLTEMTQMNLSEQIQGTEWWLPKGWGGRSKLRVWDEQIQTVPYRDLLCETGKCTQYLTISCNRNELKTISIN